MGAPLELALMLSRMVGTPMLRLSVLNWPQCEMDDDDVVDTPPMELLLPLRDNEAREIGARPLLAAETTAEADELCTTVYAGHLDISVKCQMINE